jgi:hypothetical protein
MDSREAEGPDVVPGVLALRGLGFEPVEEYTGALWVADVWPRGHRRSMAETRDSWLTSMPETAGRVWLLRSPWPSLTLREAFNAMWRCIERPEAEQDPDRLRADAAEFLSLSEGEATRWRGDSEE